MNSGIYKITNLVNKKIYIGSAINFIHRKSDHFSRLRGNYHYNRHLQRAFNKYGEVNFIFETIAFCPKEYLLKLEQWFIDNLKPDYNICKIAGNTLGRPVTDQARENLRKARKLIKRTSETIRKAAETKKIPIVQLDIQGKFIQKWPSCIDASRSLSINKAHITSCCRGKLNSIGGYKWQYA